MSQYTRFIRPWLFRLSPETAHQAAIQSLKLSGALLSIPPKKIQSRKVMGLQFPNPLGVAAGLDKNGECINGLGNLGFGFIEIGTVTPRPQDGNPKPRLFRLPEQQALINRLGFNNKGIDYLINQVKQRRFPGVLGINIGKNFDTPVANALDDYLIGLEKAYAYADYITVNISSPNTPNLRDLQAADALENLLQGLTQRHQQLAETQRRYVPLAVKIAPDLSETALQQLIDTLLKFKIDAVIATNTTLDRQAVEHSEHAKEQGGLSGAPLHTHSTQIIRWIKQYSGNQLAIIGVGGIHSSVQAQEKLAAGADLLQVYTGLIYEGTDLVSDILADF